MNFRVEINGFTVIADSVEAVLALVGRDASPPPRLADAPSQAEGPRG